MCLMQNFESGMQTSPHLVVEVKLKEHFDFTPGVNPAEVDGELTDPRPKDEEKLDQ